ncbi:hypothetical protein [Curtobacterium sp. 24E2]|nr:hypothetical protein JN350_09370 [Curtobacterium sp. 24E2]
MFDTIDDVNELMMDRTRLVVRTKEIAAARDAVARTHLTYGLQVGAVDDAPFVFEETVSGTELLSLESTRCTGIVRGEVESGDAVIVTWLKAGRGPSMANHCCGVGRCSTEKAGSRSGGRGSRKT